MKDQVKIRLNALLKITMKDLVKIKMKDKDGLEMVKLDMVKVIIFDLDDTLLWDAKSVKEAFVLTCKEAQKKYDLDAEKLENAVRESARQLYASYAFYPFTQMIGINPFEGLWGDFTDIHHASFRQMHETVPSYRAEAWTKGLAALGIDDPELGSRLGELFPVMRRQNAFVYEDTFKVLDRLRGKYRLLLLTNGAPSLQNEKLAMTPELIPYFEQMIISGAFGRGKPDPSIFEHALFLMRVAKEEALMVGDNLKTDILGANRTGIKNVWINREGQTPHDDIQPTLEIKALSELPGLLTI